MDYLTFFAIILTIWPGYLLLYIFGRGISRRIDLIFGNRFDLDLFDSVVKICNSQKNRKRDDKLDDLIIYMANKAEQYYKLL